MSNDSFILITTHTEFDEKLAQRILTENEMLKKEIDIDSLATLLCCARHARAKPGICFSTKMKISQNIINILK